MGFNVADACKFLFNSTGTQSKHQCAKYVRMAMEAGGLSTAGRPTWAWQYHTTGFLSKNGWGHIASINSTQDKEWTLQNAQPGDIAVMAKPGAESTHPGHIAMFTGKQWISDFKQSNAFVYKDTGNSKVEIYRYGSRDNVEGCGGFLSEDVNFIYNVPREEQKDHILMDELKNVYINLVKETLESEGIIFLKNNRNKLYCLGEDILIKYKKKLKGKDYYFYNKKETSGYIKKLTDIPLSGIKYKNDTADGETGDKSVSEGIVENIRELGIFPEGSFGMPGCLLVTDTGLSEQMVKQICLWEAGKPFGMTMTAKELKGVDIGDAGGHRTFGYGSLYYKGKYMDTIKQEFTQEELEKIFLEDVTEKTNVVKSWAAKNGLTLRQGQIDALVSACYNFGTGFLTQQGKVYSNTVNMIKKNPNDLAIKNSWAHMSDKQGQKYPGLIKRREQEANWYFA